MLFVIVASVRNVLNYINVLHKKNKFCMCVKYTTKKLMTDKNLMWSLNCCWVYIFVMNLWITWNRQVRNASSFWTSGRSFVRHVFNYTDVVSKHTFVMELWIMQNRKIFPYDFATFLIYFFYSFAKILDVIFIPSPFLTATFGRRS